MSTSLHNARARQLGSPTPWIALLLCGVLALSACQLLVGYEGSALGSSGAAGSGASGAGAAGIGGVAGSTPDREPAAVNVEGPDQSTYQIHKTEVTQGQYTAWLASAPSTANQPGYCEWNTSFEPDATCMEIAPQSDLHPQMCVDWCDAHAFCDAMEKRLCGNLAGGPSSFASTGDPTESQWFRACTNGGAYNYPYGMHYDPAKCDVLDADLPADLDAVMSHPQCINNDGVYDMSGKVSEWMDACEAFSGMLDRCRLRGGGFMDAGEDTSCRAYHAQFRNSYDPAVGFRCCSL